LKNVHNETISQNNLYKISRSVMDLKNLHNETISRNNLYKISQKKVQRNFAKLKSLLSLFRISRSKKCYFATTLLRVGIHKDKSNGCSIGFTKLICTQSPLKTIDLGPLTKKSNSLKGQCREMLSEMSPWSSSLGLN
jgi:hypothetical protein